MKDNMLEWIQEGHVLMPAALLRLYKSMNLNEEELVLLLQVMSFLEKGNSFPTPSEISSRMTISVSHCTEILRRLIQKGFIAIEEGLKDNGIRYERYSIQPLWEKLVERYMLEKHQEESIVEKESEINLYTMFEQEFGRPLSPFECETLTLWVDDDKHDPVIIKAALKEAVLSGKLNFRYIDRILFEWKKNGIKTVEQAKNQGKKFRQYQAQAHRQKDADVQTSKVAPLYNWLEQ